MEIVEFSPICQCRQLNSPTEMYYWANKLEQAIQQAHKLENKSTASPTIWTSQHSFSAPYSVFYNPVAVDGHHFSRERPSSLGSPIVENSYEKGCSACGQRFSFFTRECGECGRMFCSQCCVQRILKRGTKSGSVKP